MWRSLWRSIDRFSLQEFKELINELQEIKSVDTLNREFVVDILRSIVEIVTYGDRRDPSIFECFMENQILAEFLRILKISRNSSIEPQLLHYLSIMIQNLNSDHAIYYCLSNEYVNNIILHPFEFDGGDLAHYYVSFLRTVSGKLNRDTICLLVRVQEDAVVSFPLYSEALKFACHEEKMIQIAVRALTLSIYDVSDDMAHAFITTPPVSNYFYDLVMNLREKCFNLDAIVNVTEENYTNELKKELLLGTDKVIDDLYYLKDILRVGEPRLSILIIENLINILVFPILLPSLQLYQNMGSHVSSLTSLYILSCLLQVVNGKELVNAVAVALLYPYMFSSLSSNSGTISRTNPANSSVEHLNEIEDHVTATAPPESDGMKNSYMVCLPGHLSEYILLNSHSGSYRMDDNSERDGILPLIFSGNHSLLLASLMFLLVLSESKDLDGFLSSMIGLAQKNGMEQTMALHILPSYAIDGSIFVMHMPQILIALLKFLVSQPPFSAPALWNAGWILRRLLMCQEKKLTSQVLNLFNFSYEKSCERLLKEVNECWFDYILVTLKNEWESCKTVLEESSQSKDPFFALEPTCQNRIPAGDISSSLAWQRMVDAVKVFVLHHLLKAFVLEEAFQGNPLLHLMSSSMNILETTEDFLPANFGKELGLGLGIPCKISFSKNKVRDIFLIPVAKEVSGNLFLVEKLSLHSDRGVVIAVAPLAGSNPIIDENHPTWLHIRIRERPPKLEVSKSGWPHSSAASDHVSDGRWIVGFSKDEACEAARSLILKETSKQRACVESILVSLFGSTSSSDC